MNKHTPGPWKAKYTVDFGVVVAPDGEDVAVIYGRRDPTAKKSDTRLIAAAPDLLDALKRVDDLLTKGVLIRDITRDAKPDWALEMMNLVSDLKMIKLAIAKATIARGGGSG